MVMIWQLALRGEHFSFEGCKAVREASFFVKTLGQCAADGDPLLRLMGRLRGSNTRTGAPLVLLMQGVCGVAETLLTD